MADAPVDDSVAHLGDHPADHGRVDHHLHLDVLAGGLGQRPASRDCCSSVRSMTLRT